MIGGVVLGLVTTGALWAAGDVVRNVGPLSNQEFGVSRGAAWFYLITLLLTFAALVVLFLRPVIASLNGRLRAFLLTVLFIMLGGMSLCNLFSANFLKG